jgi:hypothetical protein
MKYYKEFSKTFIGSSDIAGLVLSGYRNDDGHVVEPLYFGEDGRYAAYIVTGDTEIGSHYHLRTAFNDWLKIYDDDGLTLDLKAKEIRIYRAGEFGCVIQLIN